MNWKVFLEPGKWNYLLKLEDEFICSICSHYSDYKWFYSIQVQIPDTAFDVVIKCKNCHGSIFADVAVFDKLSVTVTELEE